MEDFDNKDLLAIVLTIILPPLGVFLKVGLSTHFWINLVLTLFGFWICGLIHGLCVVLRK